MPLQTLQSRSVCLCETAPDNAGVLHQGTVCSAVEVADGEGRETLSVAVELSNVLHCLAEDGVSVISSRQSFINGDA